MIDKSTWMATKTDFDKIYPVLQSTLTYIYKMYND